VVSFSAAGYRVKPVIRGVFFLRPADKLTHFEHIGALSVFLVARVDIGLGVQVLRGPWRGYHFVDTPGKQGGYP
jgi:hypothetical protein